MAGADAVMTTSSLLRNGVGHLTTLLNGMQIWMETRGYTSVAQMKGSMSQQKVADPTAFERANYIKILQNYKSPYIAAPQRPVDVDSFYQEFGDPQVAEEPHAATGALAVCAGFPLPASAVTARGRAGSQAGVRSCSRRCKALGAAIFIIRHNHAARRQELSPPVPPLSLQSRLMYFAG